MVFPYPMDPMMVFDGLPYPIPLSCHLLLLSSPTALLPYSFCLCPLLFDRHDDRACTNILYLHERKVL